ncbi:MAG: hypothetical protein SWJ54_19475, partial [Cyanobacteriota bacterium]|nr:hypothetical protein [Cyanobacteriota bacterium]
RPETCAEVVVKVQNLLREIEQKKYSGVANTDKSAIARDALNTIKNDEKFKKQVIDTYKKLGFSHFKMFVNHPAVDLIIDDLKKLM